ncbi:MAG: methyl-accepting chemotaxis protein [Sphingomonas sp.]
MSQSVALNDATAKVARNLRGVAGSLSEIARSVGHEAAEATDAARRASEQIQATALLAAELAAIAEQVEAGVRQQAALLVEARAAVGRSGAVVEALGAAADGIGSITQLIAGIATQSRLLALNARIEAARAGEAGRGFDVVANAIKTLSQQTFDATRDIDARTGALHRDVDATQSMFGATRGRVDQQEAIADELGGASHRQGEAASDLVKLSSAAVEGVEETATIIGRVSSSAVAVDVLARQIVKAAEALGR